MAPPSRAERKLETEAQIREAARARFIEVGYDKTTIRDIARAAGVSVGSVHVHFKDKRALLFACFYANIAQAVARIFATLDEDQPLLDQLTHCGRVLYRAYAQHPALSRVMVKESLFIAAQHDTPDEQLEPFLARVATLFEAAHARGELTRLPGGSMLAAQSFFATYFAVLIGGLNGHYGQSKRPDRAARRWAQALRSLLALQLVGLGLDPQHLDEEALA